MKENYILLKFISSADKSNKKKYLKDFLSGNCSFHCHTAHHIHRLNHQIGLDIL